MVTVLIGSTFDPGFRSPNPATTIFSLRVLGTRQRASSDLVIPLCDNSSGAPGKGRHDGAPSAACASSVVFGCVARHTSNWRIAFSRVIEAYGMTEASHQLQVIHYRRW